MKLKKLYISRSWNGETVSGDIEFSNDIGTVTLKLDNEACKKMLEICAESLVNISKEVATELTNSCM